MIVDTDYAPYLTPYPDYSENLNDGIGVLKITKCAFSRTVIDFINHHPFALSRWTGIYNSGGFEWFKLATAEPPAHLQFPVRDNVTISTDSYYCKDQFGKVTISLYVTKPTAMVQYEQIASLPVGYRPSIDVDIIVGWINAGGSVAALGSVSVRPNGQILVDLINENAFGVRLTKTFDV